MSVEINEAFASQALACIRELGLDRETSTSTAAPSPWPSAGRHRGAHHRQGGVAAAGVRARYALATQCIGGGQGIATVLEAV